jgi:O-antigen biosynthesis protein WbqP
MDFRIAAGVDKMKPGITGWAQINGRDSISIEKKVQLDQEYMNKRSLLFDI